MSHHDHHQMHDHSGHSSMGMNSTLNTTTMSPIGMSHEDHSSHISHNHQNHGSAMTMGDGQSAAGGHHNMMMHMYFHGGDNETILFEFWKISETGGLIASMVVIFLLAFVYEALKFYREHLYRNSFQTVQVDTVAVPVENGGAIKETHKTVQIATTSVSNNPYAPEVNPIFITQGNCSCPDLEEKSENTSNNNATSLSTCSPNPSTSVPRPKPRPVHYKVRMLSVMHAWQTILHVLQVVLSYFLMLIFMTYNIWLCLAVALGAGAGYFFFGWKKSLVVDITEHCH